MPPCNCQNATTCIAFIKSSSSANILSLDEQNSISVLQESSTYEQSHSADSEGHHQADCGTNYLKSVWAGGSGDACWSTLLLRPFPPLRLLPQVVMLIHKINNTFQFHSPFLYSPQTALPTVTLHLPTLHIVTSTTPSSTTTTTMILQTKMISLL